jgi:hypothetical protein
MKKARMMDAVLRGSVEWAQARKAAMDMTAKLQGEVDELQSILKMQDAYSPIAWLNVCQQLRVVTDGMIVMRMLAKGETTKRITAETGILSGSIAAYKAWNTMYAASIKRGVHKRIKIKGRTEAEQAADIAFLRACGITFDLQPHDEAEVE